MMGDPHLQPALVYLRTWSGSYMPLSFGVLPRWALGWVRHWFAKWAS